VLPYNLNKNTASYQTLKRARKQKKNTSRLIIAMAGTGNSHGASPNQAISGGLVHNNTKLVATISCK
jgi:hypothetical protein